MVRFTGGLLLFSAFSRAAPPDRPPRADQVVLHNPQKSSGNPRKLQGKFLHVTDFHPDPFYRTGSEPSGEHPCHKGSGKGLSGYYGAEATDCDSPYSLVNETFNWIEKHIKDDIDFVVWTGDSARHDNDEQYPRNDKQVQDQNKYLVHKFVEVFGKDDNIDDPDPTNDFVVPIVPTFGNNDILPHNIFTPGPNRWTRKYEDIWRRFVPQAQRHSFARGGWFFTEVIPNRLAVFSLNTLYFFDSNSAVDGCDAKSEPGYEHFEWLRIQLEFLRQRKMKAILTGHVPPARTESKQNWDETCYQKYVLWLRQYRDVIVGSIFGHMNIDHFMFQDVSDLKYKFDIEGIDDEVVRRDVDFNSVSNDPTFTIAGKADYLNELRHGWSKLPKPPKHYSFRSEDLSEMRKKKQKSKKQKYLDKIGGPYAERFSLSLVSPSVVPNFFPSIRIIEYNVTGLEHDHPAQELIGTPAEDTIIELLAKDDGEVNDKCEEAEEMVERDDDIEAEKKKRKKKKRKKKNNRPNFHIPKPPSSTSSPGPAYSPQALTLLSWTQFYANLTAINAGVQREGVRADAKKKAKHFKFEMEYATKDHEGYNMTDLTVRSWLELAGLIGKKKLSMSAIEQSDKVDGDVDSTEAAESDFDVSSDQDISTERKKKKKKKHKKKTGKSSSKPKNHMWRTFVRRAFVGAKDEEDLEGSFG